MVIIKTFLSQNPHDEGQPSSTWNSADMVGYKFSIRYSGCVVFSVKYFGMTPGTH